MKKVRCFDPAGQPILGHAKEHFGLDRVRLERKTKSELFRDMVRAYEDHLDEERWQRLKRLGRSTARKYHLTSEKDIEKLVHEARGIRD